MSHSTVSRLSNSLMAVIAIGSVVSVPTFSAPAREAYSVVSNGEKIGALVATIEGRRVDIDWRIDDNGRGPKIRERNILDARGVPVERQIEGKAYIGAPVKESFKFANGVARYRTLNDSGQMRAGAAPVYLDNEGSPWIIEIAARLALAAPNKTISVSPSGTVTIAKMRDVTLGAGERAIRGTAYAVTGFALQPIFVVLDAQGKLLAQPSAGYVMMREGYESEFQKLSELAQELDAESLAQLTREQMKRYAVPIYIRDVRVFDSAAGALSEPTTVAVFRGRIANLRADLPAKGAAVVVDGAGGTLLPGLFDMHGHYGAWAGPLHLAAGVTTVRDMGNDNESLLAIKAKIDSSELLGPRLILSGFLEGRSPFSARGGFVIDNVQPALEAVRWYADRGFRQIKIYNSMTPDWVAPIAAEAHRLGLKVSGHVPAFMTAERAVRDGYDEINHINQLLLSFVIGGNEDTRTPFRFTALGERVGKLDLSSAPVQRMLALMKERGTAFDPTLSIFQQMLLARPGITSPNDAGWIDHVPAAVQRQRRTAALDIKPEQRPAYEATWRKLLEVMKLVHDSGIRIVPGTDDIAGFALHSELEAYALAGIPAARILQMATLDSARYLGLDQQVGSIERGKVADLLLVDGDPTQDIRAIRKIKLVMKDGAILMPPDVHRAIGAIPFTKSPTIDFRAQ